MSEARKIALVDFQMGNLHSVRLACEHVGLECNVTAVPEDLYEAAGIILPGVGAFPDAMEQLRNLGLDRAITECVRSGKPLLGICLGMQLLLSESEEFGNNKGLGLVPGRVKRFPGRSDENKKYRVPQIGWNTIRPPQPSRWEGTALESLSPGTYMYFVHSYFAEVSEPNDVLSVTDYAGLSYCSGFQKDHITAVQFHPEKSSLAGLDLYRSWARQHGIHAAGILEDSRNTGNG